MALKYYKNGNRHSALSGEDFIQVMILNSVCSIKIGSNSSMVQDILKYDVEASKEEFWERFNSVKAKIDRQITVLQSNN